MKIFKFRFSTLIFLAVFTACAINPVTGKKQISFMSEAQEIAMGKQSDPAIIAQFGLYQNEALQQFIQEKGQEMAAISHRPGLGYEFKILDSDVVNAFAVPGGYVYFTRGIMAHFNNEAQFAGVLGHEIGHIAARHSAQQYTKQMLAQIAFMGGMIASEKFRDFAGDAMQGMELLFLKFSRTAESESDQLGVYYSSQVGYDAHEMADFFKTLERMSGGGDGGRLPEFLSTHPDPGRRYEAVNRMTDEYRDGKPVAAFTVNRDSYLELLDGIVYGEDPRQGYVDNSVFYHPELKFEYPVPRSWRLANSPSQVQMAPEDGKALMVLMAGDGSRSLQDEATAIKEKYKLQNTSGRSVTIHGLQGYSMLGDYPQQDPYTGATSYLALQTVLIRYNDLTYLFHGLCEKADLSAMSTHFDRTMLGFKPLSDPARINVLPERLDIATVNSSTTFRAFLSQQGIPASRLDELAILNGMEVDQPLAAGQRVKLVKKSANP